MTGSDFEFTFRWVPNNYQARAQRAAVLYPLMGIAHSAAGVSRKTRELVRVWRTRVAVLVDAGWSPRRDPRGIAYMRNCTPSFVSVSPLTRPCNQRTICPFCYSRWVRDVWSRVDGAFPYGRETRIAGSYLTLSQSAGDVEALNDVPATHIPEPGSDHMDGRPLRSIVLDDGDGSGNSREASFPYHLVEVHVKHHVDYTEQGSTDHGRCRALLKDIVARRSKRLRRIHVRGSFVTATVVPSSRGWRVRMHELHQVLPEQHIPTSPGTRVLRHTQPTRRHVFHAVVHACRYPKELMYGDAERTAMVLACRQGDREADPPIPAIRLSAMYGVFRTRS